MALNNITASSWYDDDIMNSTISISPLSPLNTSIGGGYITTTAGMNGTVGAIGASNLATNTVFSVNQGSNVLSVKGDAEFDGRVKIGGVDLAESIKNIEQRLNILHPNKELESRWEELRALGEQYRQLEADILGKEELINLLTK